MAAPSTLPGRNGPYKANVMKCMPVFRSFLASLLCLVMFPTVTPSQQIAAGAATDPPPTQQPRFVGEVKEVITPVTVGNMTRHRRLARNDRKTGMHFMTFAL